MKYAGGNAAVGAFSGRPRPFGRWQKPQPRRPLALAGPSLMMSGMAGWSRGYQSATLLPSRMSTSENEAVLPGNCRALVCSSGSSFGRRLRVGAACGVALSPGFGDSRKPYAHSGWLAKSIGAAGSAAVARAEAAGSAGTVVSLTRPRRS